MNPTTILFKAFIVVPLLDRSLCPPF